MSQGASQARAWVEHLRAGGATPWATFRDQPGGAPTAPDTVAVGTSGTSGAFPGAIQLEVLRRLNAQGAVAADVAERVLASSPPGRGLPDLELVGVARETGFGPRPVDPFDLPVEELVRLAVGVLADQVSDLGAPLAVDQAVAGAGPGPLRLQELAPWRRRIDFAGDPWTADHVRIARAQHGIRRGLRSPEVFVLASDLPTWLWHIWSWRVVTLARPVTWSWWLDRWLGRGTLPPRADLPAIVARRAHQVGAARVRIVCGVPARAASGHGSAREFPPSTRALTTAGAATMDVQARTNEVLRVMLPEARVRAISADRLWPLLAQVQLDQSGPGASSPPEPGGIPDRYRDFLDAAGARMSRLVRDGDYPVLGDPALLEQVSTGSDRAQEDKVLDVALQAVRRAGRAGAPPDEGGVA